MSLLARREMKGGPCSQRTTRRCVLVFAALVVNGPAYGESWRVTPSITLLETLTDNVALVPDDRKQSDLVTQLTPALRIDGTGARLRLNLNYRMRNLLYASESGQNRTQHFLNANGTLEAVENWLFVDASGSITQQPISAFAAQPADTGNINANRSQTSAYRLSPYIRGRLGAVADYQLRYSWSTAMSGAAQFGDTSLQQWTGSIRSSADRATLGWAVDGQSRKIDSDVRRAVEAHRLRGTLIYRFSPDFNVFATAGQETNNYTRAGNQSYTNYGGGFQWTPTPRTQLSARQEKRFFGDGREIAFQHRTPLTAWRFSASKDASVLPGELATAPLGTAFDLLFDALASRFPDPIERAQEVERQLEQDAIPPDLILGRSFLTTRVFVANSRQAAVTILGVRNNITFAANLTEREAISTGAGPADDFTLSSTIEQRSISANWVHRLSPRSSLSLLASQIHTTGTAASGLESTQYLARLLLSHRVGRRTTASLGARMRRFDSSVVGSDFREKALTASVSMTF